MPSGRTRSRSLPLSALMLTAAVWGATCERVSTVEAAGPQDPEAPRRATKPIVPGDMVPVRLTAKPQAVTTGEPAESPLTLSDPDGQDLILEDLSVRAAVEGMLSFTELELKFRNPHGRRMEGRFTATLPPGATISRFAKEVNGQLMEGEVVERLRANQIYDQILQEMRDPALLEQDQGNRFSAKIFPIEANATVRLVLSYSRLLPLENGVRTFSLPLRGMPTIGKYSFHGLFSALPGETSADLTAEGGLEGPSGARRSAVQVLDLTESRFTPQHDLEVRWRPTEKAPAVQVLQAGDFYLTSFRAPALVKAAPASDRRPWVFYIDTSASGAEGMVHRITALEQLLGALLPSDRVELFAFDQQIEPLLSGSAGEAAKQVGAALKARGFLGGTDLHSTLTAIADQATKRGDARFVLVTDGVATLGRTDRRLLIDAAAKIPAGTTLHALVLGSREDEEVLNALTNGRGRKVTLPFTESMTRSAREAAKRLALPVGATVQLKDAGAEWLFPQQVNDVQPGAEVITVGKLKTTARPATRLESQGKVALEVSSSGTLPLGTFEPLLEREGYRAYLSYLSDRENREENEAVRQALAKEQVQVSVERRVLIPRTTLLVLESEADYDRFGLDRRALASILTLGPTGIELLDRSRAGRAITDARPVTAPAEEKEARKKDKGRPEKAASKSIALKRSRSETASAPGDMKMAEESGPSDDAEGSAAMGEAPAATMADSMGMEPELDAAPQAEGGGSSTVTASGRGMAQPRQQSATLSLEAPPPAPGAPPRVSAAPAASAPAPEPAPVRGRADNRPRRDAESDRGRAITGGATVYPEWTQGMVATESDVQQLLDTVKANPRERGAYNRLSEALASRKDWKLLRRVALEWQAYDPENPQVYESLGEAALNLGQEEETSRAFASLVEIAPSKPELLQRAGLLLLRVDEKALAEAPLRRALELRPDRVNAYRHLAILLWQQGRIEEAARVLEDATKRQFPSYYGNVQRVLREELAYVYRAWMVREPKREAEIRKRAKQFDADIERGDAMRITLAWETDANDVDLHVVDPAGEECYYSHKETRTGLALYEDITRGLGPEVIRTRNLVPGTYYVGVNYFSAGPMGVSRGVLVVMQPDARGAEPQVKILPFRLVEGGRDMRLLAAVEVTDAAAKAVTE